MIGISKAFTYSSALRITSASIIALPSSENAMQPAPTISPISEISLPAEPFVIAPIGNTFTIPSFSAFDKINSVIALLSLTGFVFGMQHIVVKPPAAAAIVPVLIVSLYSSPGSLRWVWISIKPGVTILPLASIIFTELSALMPFAIFWIIIPSISISRLSSILFAGSITLLFLIRSPTHTS